MIRALKLPENNSPCLRNLTVSIRYYLEQGDTLEEALRRQERALPAHVIETVSAGERSGRLVQVFESLHKYFDESLRLQRALWRQITYPLFIMVAAVVIIPFVRDFAILNINGWRVGFLTYTLHFLWGWASPVFYSLIFVLLLRLGMFRFLTNRLALELPVFSFYTRRIALARFLWTFSILLDSAIPLPEAISRAARSTNNRLLAHDLQPAIEKIRQGFSFTEAFAGSRYLSVMMRQMIVVGETSGNLPEILRKAAEYTLDEARHLARMTISLVEAALIVWIGFRFVL